MSSPTSTAFDIAESPPPSVIADTASTLPSALTLSDRHYASDDLTVFKVEDVLFRFDRTLLEKATIPPGVGSREDPIELDHRIKATDFGILLDFLKLGTRHDKKPPTVFDWTSIIAVCCILGMRRVQNLACETLSDQQKALLDQQKTSLDQQNAPAKVSCAGAGFERDTYGMYFFIREKGTSNYLLTFRCSKSEGVQVLFCKPGQFEITAIKESMVFFIDRYGALRHAASGLAIDIIDDVPVLRRNYPASSRPNPWSRPLPEFSFVNSQIRVKFLSDPSLPSCSDDLYPKDSWNTKNFVLASRPKKKTHEVVPLGRHLNSDTLAWFPMSSGGTFSCFVNCNVVEFTHMPQILYHFDGKFSNA